MKNTTTRRAIVTAVTAAVLSAGVATPQAAAAPPPANVTYPYWDKEKQVRWHKEQLIPFNDGRFFNSEIQQPRVMGRTDARESVCWYHKGIPFECYLGDKKATIIPSSLGSILTVDPVTAAFAPVISAVINMLFFFMNLQLAGLPR